MVPEGGASLLINYLRITKIPNQPIVVVDSVTQHAVLTVKVLAPCGEHCACNLAHMLCFHVMMKYILFEAKLKARNPKESTPLNNIR